MVKRFLDYVELRTKSASVLPFLTALAYCFFLQNFINIRASLLFFAAMLLFDMTATMINNYIDYRQAGKPGHFSRPVMLIMIFCALLAAALIGLYLSWLYGAVFLLAGIFCFFIGITYTFGPMPISRSPYGELFSGLTMGLVLPFLVVTINMPALIYLEFNGWNASVSLDILGLLKFCLVFAPLVFCISNILVANNIRDFEADKAVRYTMVRHIGVKNALRLFEVNYFLCYAAVIVACALGVIPWVCLFVLVTFIPVFRNIRIFSQKQGDASAFVIVIQNFFIFIVPYALCIFIGGLV